MTVIKAGLDKILETQILPNDASEELTQLFSWREDLVRVEHQLRRLKTGSADFVANVLITIATEMTQEILKQLGEKK